MQRRNKKGLNLIHSKENGQKGFTLIELIMVIVILGILAVVAVPKYQDLKTDAAVAQANGVLGAAQGAAAIHFANFLINGGVHLTDGAGLLAAMDSTPNGWAATDTHIDTTINSVTYTITVTTAETDTAKAVLTLSSS